MARKKKRNRARGRVLRAKNKKRRKKLGKPLKQNPLNMKRLGNRIKKIRAQDEETGQGFIDKFLPNVDAIGGHVDASRSSEVAQNLARLRERALTAGNRTADTSEFLNRLKGGLGGINAAENTALREGAQRGLDRQFAQNQRRAQVQGARSGLRGAGAGAQMRDLGRQRAMEQARLEQNLIAQNIGIQDSRRQQFGQFLSGAEQAEFGRGQQANQMFTNTMNTARADELARQQFNIGQDQRLTAGQQALFFGGAALNAADRSQIQNIVMGGKNIDVAKEASQLQFEAAKLAAEKANALAASV